MALSSQSPQGSSSRRKWDLTHLSAKYPWLRVDAETIEEFRSPFQWVDVAQPPRHQPHVQHRSDASRPRSSGDTSEHSGDEERDESATFSLSESQLRRRRAKNLHLKQHQHRRLPPPSTRQALPSPGKSSKLKRALAPSEPATKLTLERVASASASLPSDDHVHQSAAARDAEEPAKRESLLLALHEADPLYQAVAFPVSRPRRRHRKAKKSHNILSLSFPVLSKALPTTSKATSFAGGAEAIALEYSKQLKVLADAEQKLKDRVSSQIEAEKAKLPLTFLFERNLDRHYCKEKGVLTISTIFSKLQHRLLFAAFERWCKLVDAQQTQEREDAAFKRSQVRALAFFNRLAGDAYVGTLNRAFSRWHTSVRDLVALERHRAATTIQVRFRQRRAEALLRDLKQAALDKEFKHKAEIQQLLRFEAYGRAMQWSTLRNGFDLLLQNHCARQIQLLARRFMLQRRIARRVARKRAAIAIQSHWRRVLAKRELAHRKQQRRIRQELEARAATTIQAHARVYLARREAARRREWRSNENARALEIQQGWRRYRERLELHRRFAARRVLLDVERARLAELERLREAARREQQREASALVVQRVYRGFRGRCAFCSKLAAQRLELAARRVQTSWRRSQGRYVLQLRFSAQRDRLEAQRQCAALRIQCCFRGFRARRRLAALRWEQHRRQHAATVIQRVVRGRKARKQFARKRRATVAIQSGMRGKLARRERQRRLDEKIAHFRQMSAAATQLQRWVRGVFGRRLASRMRELRAREQELSRNAALLVQKRARGIEARKTAGLLREVTALTELEQRRHFQASSREASPLLQFMTEFYLQRRSVRAGISDDDDEDDGGVRFTPEQCLWLQERLDAARQQIAREDAAVVFLQRMYRGFVARVDFVVKKVRAKLRRELEIKMAIRIQRYTRGFLARRRVAKLRQQRRLEELKLAYIRERKWKADEQRWKEQYHREQVELQIRKAKDMERKLREAKRDAELAKLHVEVAALKRQELVAQQELARQERKQAKSSLQQQQQQTDDDSKKTPAEDDLLADGWVEMADEYGNAYYYNESSFESSWDRPTRTPVATVDATPTTPSPSADGSLKSSAMLSSIEKSAPDKQTEGAVASKAPVVAGSACCCMCLDAPATKECLDCSDSAHRFYCASCFVLEHFSLPVGSGSSKQAHDFVLLSKAKKRAQCQSQVCREKSTDATLATYYCSECVVGLPLQARRQSAETPFELPPALSTMKQAREQQPPGCFYCETCFHHAHESAHELHHVSSNALHFRTGATLCCDCGLLVATRVCEQCDEEFCAACFERIHTHSLKKREHAWAPLEIVKDELGSDKDAYCIECDLRRASRLCNLCGDGFCDACFVSAHEKGKKQQHTWIPWESFAQVGDWLEILDEKTNATIFFNIETKESSTKKPFALKSGAERHQLQFHEREQLQKRKELELESEIVKLREQVREMQEKEALAQRPLSRALRSAGGPGGAGQQTPGTIADSTKSRGSNEAKIAKRKGLIGRLFSRSTKAAAGAQDDGLTPDERRRNELIHSIRADEQALVTSKMTTRSREEKETKAAETLGTKQFEAAILHELTKS